MGTTPRPAAVRTDDAGVRRMVEGTYSTEVSVVRAAPTSSLDPRRIGRPLAVALFSDTLETRRAVSAECVPPTYTLLDTPAAGGTSSHEDLAARARGADLILHDWVYVPGPVTFCELLRHENPDSCIILLTANPLRLGHLYRGGVPWRQWVRERTAGLPPIDGWAANPLSREALRDILVSLLSMHLATPTVYATLAGGDPDDD
jgi:hypothetical protein